MSQRPLDGDVAPRKDSSLQSIGIISIYFFYGLAFFSMGLLVAIEGGRSSDERVRKALRPLAGFGLVHAAHEWIEMFAYISLASGTGVAPSLQILRLSTLAFPFSPRRIWWIPVGKGRDRPARGPPHSAWPRGCLGIELANLKGNYPPPSLLWGGGRLDPIFARHSCQYPCCGRTDRPTAGFPSSRSRRFGQDALWAAVAFAWYGMIGQAFTRATPAALRRHKRGSVSAAFWLSRPVAACRGRRGSRRIRHPFPARFSG